MSELWSSTKHYPSGISNFIGGCSNMDKSYLSYSLKRISG